ncbi:MAG: NACHT domain-containing protein [Verrucomicrobiales bacterium]|nr:NACHT domain-containing protein [Verrucomicrobiales bacterium]
MIYTEFDRKFRGLFDNAFQDWVESVLQEIYPNGKLVRVGVTQGDGGIDAFAINTGTVFQVFAPRNPTDGKVANKIANDFPKALETMGEGLKHWIIIHNTPTSKMGKLATAQIGRPQKEYPGLEFSAWGIEELWRAYQEATGFLRKAKEALLNWNRQSFSTFRIPLLGVEHPASLIWDELSVRDGAMETTSTSLADELRLYREWARLGKVDSGKTRSATEVLEDGANLVVVGGPGSGKSTLARKLVHEAVERDQTVLVASLKRIALIYRKRDTFADAVFQIGSGNAPPDARRTSDLLDELDLLILDGLDEAEPSRAEIAEEIRQWSVGHPSTRVCVTTRPIGHQPHYLSAFKTAEILPLSETRSREVITRTIEKKNLSEAESKRLNAIFKLGDDWPRWRESPNAFDFAKKSPLLLSFLIALAIGGKSLEGKRSELYGRIVDLFRTREVPGDDDPALSARMAMHLLSLLAVQSLDRPTMPLADIVGEVAGMLSQATGDPELKSAGTVESAIQFWVKRGMMEKIKVDTREFLVFVHPTFAEYAAALWLGEQPEKEIATWTKDRSRNPEAREILILAGAQKRGELVIELLLSLDEPEDPLSAETVIALEAIGEKDGTNPELVQKTSGLLETRLVSNIPLISIEAARQMVAIAPAHPDQIGPLCTELLDHDQMWTRLAAYAGLLEIETSNSVDFAKSFLSDKRWMEDGDGNERVRDLPQDGGQLWQQTIVRAVVIVSDVDDTDEMNRLIREFVASDREVTVATIVGLEETLGSERLRAVVAGTTWDITSGLSGLLPLFPDHKEKRFAHAKMCAKIILDSLESSEVIVEEDDREELTEFNRLLGAIEVAEAPIPDYLNLVSENGRNSAVEVFRGLIEVLVIDRENLISDCSKALAETSADRMWERIEHLFVEDFPIRDSYNLAEIVSPEILVRSLLHPSGCIHRWGTYLIRMSCSEIDFRPELEATLAEVTGSALFYVGLFAEEVWGEQAVAIIRRRSESNSLDGVGYLCEAYGKIRSKNKQEDDWEFLISMCEHGESAVGAAKGLENLSFPATPEYGTAVRDAFTTWCGRDLSCKHCGEAVIDGVCSNCNVVAETPVASLLRELIRMELVDRKELLSLSADENRKKSEPAIAEILRHARGDEEVQSEVIEWIAKTGKEAHALLRAFVRSDVRNGFHFASELLSTLEKIDVGSRAIILAEIPHFGLEHDTKTEALQRGLSDPAPQVRDVSVEALRLLAAQSDRE